jgi:hypothetical protein
VEHFAFDDAPRWSGPTDRSGRFVSTRYGLSRLQTHAQPAASGDYIQNGSDGFVKRAITMWEFDGYIEVTPSLGAILETFVAIAALVALFAGRLYLGRLAAEWFEQLPPHLRGRWMQQAFD